MAFRDFTLEEAKSPQSLLDKGWSQKGAHEVWQFSTAITPWLQVLEKRHGKIDAWSHADGGDDPPDVMGKLGKKVMIGFEITRLLPQKIGHFDHVVEDVAHSRFTARPTLSGPSFDSHEEMKNYALNYTSNKAWVSVVDEAVEWYRECWRMFHQKAIKAQASKFNYVIMTSDQRSLDAKITAECMHKQMQEIDIDLPGLILHSQISLNQFQSWFLEKGCAIRYASR